MNDDMKSQQGTDDNTADDTTLMGRRDFLRSLDKWSKVVIGSALFGGAMLKLGAVPDAEAGAWANRAGGGGAWANRAGGGGAWANRGGAWANRGGTWVNGGGSWVNRF
ncbi:MAG: hypothetical protein ABTS16_07440 [Candidatus Accumulibacter phosphatis]|jgi:hypothetical protein|nr:hypothetical protein [Candidatus Accumulibacter contiguus]HRF13530.1 hypothetical protein [Candidatus Accumulibacter phosphatis]